MEFATIAVGLLGVLYWGLTFWQTVLAIVIGTGLGSVTHAVLSTWGPKSGLCQMVLSRTGFGFLGNVLPGGPERAHRRHRLVRGQQHQRRARAACALGLAPEGPLSRDRRRRATRDRLLGHNLVHVFERYAFPILTIIFVVSSIIVLSKSHPGCRR